MHQVLVAEDRLSLGPEFLFSMTRVSLSDSKKQVQGNLWASLQERQLRNSPKRQF